MSDLGMGRLLAYAAWWEALTPESVSAGRALLAPGVRFKDPFQDIVGVDRVEAMLRHMFASIEAPRFRTLDAALGRSAGYLRWRFTGRRRGARAATPGFAIEGMSEVMFDATGRVAAHTDHWDAASQIYEGVPMLGTVLRFAKRKALGG